MDAIFCALIFGLNGGRSRCRSNIPPCRQPASSWSYAPEVCVCILKRLIRSAACRCEVHNSFDWNLRRPPVISSHVMANVALGNDADQLATVLILDNGCASAPTVAHRFSGVLRRIARCAAGIRVDWFHLVATTSHTIVPSIPFVATSHEKWMRSTYSLVHTKGTSENCNVHSGMHCGTSSKSDLYPQLFLLA